ncbi:MAG: glutamate--tRNA ligase [Bacteroidales bacterium]
MAHSEVRVRFAPSPTGPLHMGGVRTALFNYLFARKYNGTFILRIEDTDKIRYMPGAEEYIINSLKWCGLEFDEGIEQGGEYGPYRQSERKELYKKYANHLVEAGKAYFAFDTAEELDAMRERLKEQKSDIQQYNAVTRKEMKNSLTLGKEKTRQLIDEGVPYVIRFKMSEEQYIGVIDRIRGEVEVNTNQLDDKILFKSDGLPTYHLANVVDDHEMKVTHVIRGEEWLPSLPLHFMLYEAFGWKDEMPEFAHLPLILKPSGKGKLSKRDGQKHGFPVFPMEWEDPETNETFPGYKESGYLPEAFINILAFLGWNPGTDKELYTMDELIEEFDLDKVGKSGSKFDPDKAKWYNHKYLMAKSDKELAEMFIPLLEEMGISASVDFVEKVCSLVKERINFIHDLWDQSWFFFKAPDEYDQKMVKKKWKEHTPDLLNELKEKLQKLNEFTPENIKSTAKQLTEDKDLGMGQVMFPFRLTLVGAGMGPDVAEIAVMIGKDETVRRIEKAVEEIG